MKKILFVFVLAFMLILPVSAKQKVTVYIFTKGDEAISSSAIDFFKELEWYFSVRDENNNEPKTSDTVVELITSLEDVVLNNHFSFNLNSKYLEAWELLDTKDDWLYFRGSRVLTYSEKFRKRLDFYRNKWYSLNESKIFQRIVYNYKFEDWSYWFVIVYLAKIKLKK